jgi:hypothetical protein
MFRANPLVARLGIAKGLGFLYGLIWFFALPAALPDASPYLCWGVLLWFTTMGGIVGMVGIFDRHPLWPSWRLPWWLRGSAMGAAMGLALVLVNYPAMAEIGRNVMTGAFQSPWWLIAETALVGAAIDFLATRAAGEGHALVPARPKGRH